MSYLLDGRSLSRKIQEALKKEVRIYSDRTGQVPGLGVILVGEDSASKTYVANKEKFAKGSGFNTFDRKLPASATQAEVSSAIAEFNSMSEVDGILLQLPVPKGLDVDLLIDSISVDKDVDGLTTLSQGKLMRSIQGGFRPCTPSGVMMLLDLYYSGKTLADIENPLTEIGKADLSGKKALVIGRSILVGKPVGLMLLERNATVTYAHSRTPDLPGLAKEFDIVVAAVGRPKMVESSWVKEGAVVIDVGINRLSDGSLCGDVNFSDLESKVAAITPVPKGVGPMTIAMLICNTFQSFKRRVGV